MRQEQVSNSTLKIKTLKLGFLLLPFLLGASNHDVWVIILVCIFFIAVLSVIFYGLNYSAPVTKTLSILNKNEKAINYFGRNIRKNTYFGKLSYETTDEKIKIEANFKVKGDKKSGYVQIKLCTNKDQTCIDELIMSDVKIPSSIQFENQN